MRKILFVDDDPEVIDEFKKKFECIRDAWGIAYATSGDNAMHLLSEATYDAVASDMYMPKMDGAELLKRVMDAYPETVRIVLSDQSDKNTVLRFAKSAQQFLLKSCDVEDMVFSIERLCKFRDLIHNKKLSMMVTGISDLPSLPTLYHSILREMQTPNPSLKKMGYIIAQDISMSAKVLQVVNSAYFSLRTEIVDPLQAAIYLGINTLKSLILSTHVFSSFSDAEGMRYGGSSLDELWRHSLLTGRLSKEIAATIVSDRITQEESFTAGLLHDVGKLIISKIPKKYTQVEFYMQNNQCDRLYAEYAVMKTSHAELGAYLLGHWKLAEAVVKAIAFHHKPSSLIQEALSTRDQSSRGNEGKPQLNNDTRPQSPNAYLTGLTILTSVHVANALMLQKNLTLGETSFTYIDMPYLNALGLTDKLPEWVRLSIAAR